MWPDRVTEWTSVRAVLLVLLAVTLAVDAPLELVGVGSETAVAVAELAFSVYGLAVVVRLLMMDELVFQACLQLPQWFWSSLP